VVPQPLPRFARQASLPGMHQFVMCYPAWSRGDVDQWSGGTRRRSRSGGTRIRTGGPHQERWSGRRLPPGTL